MPAPTQFQPPFLSNAIQPSFADRHLGPDQSDTKKMCEFLGVENLDALIEEVVPTAIRVGRSGEPLDLPQAASETEATRELAAIASRNKVFVSMLGCGWYGTHTPSVIRRCVLENPAWYTAYTPYQPEISQGRLQMLLNFQTMIADLTGMDIAGASLLDEATAAAEAMTLARRHSKAKSNRFVVDPGCHPHVLAVLATRAEPLGIDLDVTTPTLSDMADCFGVLVAEPSTTGAVVDHAAVFAAAKAAGAVSCATTDLLACVVLSPPGERGADVVVGSAQRFGVPMGFGGPHAGFLAVRAGLERALPGRLVGVSRDVHGAPAVRLALQTREQHIRREKATSNICTAQVLLAVISAAYAMHHRPDGLQLMARRVHAYAQVFAQHLQASMGDCLEHDSFFDTVCVRTNAAIVAEAARSAGINVRALDSNRVCVSFDETTTTDHVVAVLGAFGTPVSAESVESGLRRSFAVPTLLERRSPVLAHPVFHQCRSETDLLRLLRRYADFDLALDRTMIPLGSCTMKLNAASEMFPISWPEFANVHPLAPADQTLGYQQVIDDLERWLAELTGYDRVSLAPNSGAQGEFAGLLAIRAYHRANGSNRNVCLIPSSAHGTNAASAAMCGMRVVVVGCAENGDVDLDDLRAKIDAHRDDLAALMITYPSTHGVFEAAVTEICASVHEAGGQVYLDGANFNALVGVARPGAFGADVSHLNLHKTFCIPHGGGGPGVGPVCVKEHLAPYLPGSSAVPAVTSAPFGSAGILAIPWMYIKMMGPDGLTAATKQAIASANYIAARLADSYPILYTGANGRVAHECILDLRDLTQRSSITVEDVAKRLIDYGFHAPTMSFPVAGTLMVEPTESESVEEIDRFCDAMISIRAEIDQVISGTCAAEASPLRNAPHTSEAVTSDIWDHVYSRTTAAYPMPSSRSAKYWPPVGRIDGAYGDRNIMCSCPPLSELAD